MTIENPPAFPTDGRIQHGTAYDGMTLRDYFAGQALASQGRLPAHWDERSIVKWAYRVADAMLAARQEPTS